MPHINETTQAIPAVPTKQSNGAAKITTQEDLLKSLQGVNVSPLWAQMARLNPALPNPTTIPFIWEYDRIRPYLLHAGNLIKEEQAERRVLMLVNPEKSKEIAWSESSAY